ncbi:MAG TPA: AsmA family protein [Burkholderiales bacterium]|nr:AsmA family protein [Burkholderiales bacterium]
MRVLKWTAGAVLALLLVLVLFVTFGLGTLKGPVTKAVTNATGRELLIEGDFRAVWSWLHPRFRAEKVSWANPDWATEDYMFQADAVELSVKVLPLLIGRVVLPEVHLERPIVNLEIDEEGRKNWLMERDQQKEGQGSRIAVQQLTLDHGQLKYDDAGRDISLQSELSTTEDGVNVKSKGTYHGMPATLEGTAGHVLGLKDVDTPFPIDATAKVGETAIKAKGTLTNVAQLSALDLQIELKGRTMSELYDVIGLAFPETSPYTTRGRLVRGDNMIRYEKFTGKVGESDIAGTLQFDLGGKRAFMHGELTSKVLNLADLGPLVGTDQPKESGVLPDMPFDSDRWDSIDADVRIKAGSIRRPKALPLDNLSTRIQMRDKVLTLDPFNIGIAGGQIAGQIKMDGQKSPIAGTTTLRVKDLQLSKLFPTMKENQASIGDINGLVELAGRGDSVGQILGTSNGKVGLFLDGGKISRFMMNLVALDLWGAAKAKLQGDEPVEIRCAIADFGVKDGLMKTNAFVFDTQVVNVGGDGTINLKSEEMDLKLNPEPKDRSIASLNSPLFIRGTFGEPKVAPDWNRVGRKGVTAVVMGALSPLLAVLPLVKEGKDKDSPCAQLIASATKETRAPKAQQAKAQEKAKVEQAQQAEKEQQKEEEKKDRKERRSAIGGTREQPPGPPAAARSAHARRRRYPSVY